VPSYERKIQGHGSKLELNGYSLAAGTAKTY
jgi:hypothetical protein